MASETLPFPPGSLLAAYLRDSGGDEQDLSIDQQESALRAWCAEHGHTLTQIYRDTRSGTSTVGRAGFETLIRYFLQRKRVPEAGLLIWRFNRFARDLDDAQFFKSALRRKGYIIYALRDPIPEGTAGRVFEFFIDLMADKFSEDLSADVRRGQRHLLEQYGALGGIPPRGFKRSPIHIGKHRNGADHIVHRWVPDPDLWETCRLAWQMRAAGASYREIHEKTRLFSSINSYSTFYSNRIYLGELQFQDLTIPNYVEPLIDLPTWSAVQVINQRNARPEHAARAGSSFLLSGLARCGNCNSPLSGDVTKFKHETTGRGYYACSRRRRQWDCPGLRIPKQALEDGLIQYFTTIILQPGHLHALQEEQRLAHQTDAAQTRDHRAGLAAQLAGVRLRVTNTTNAIAEIGHSTSLLAKLRELETEETLLLSQIDEYDTILKTPPASFTPQRLARFVSNIATLLTRADLETRRKILKGLIAQILVKRDGKILHVHVDYYLPPDDLVTHLADLPPLDDLPFTDSPDPGFYASVTLPPGGTE